MPRTPRRILALLLAGAALASLAACAPAAPAVTDAPSASPSTTETPIFASDEEALAAAVTAYQAYTDLTTTIASDPALDADQVNRVASPPHARATIDSLGRLRASGARTEGRVTLRGFKLAEVTDAGVRVHVQMYACNDLSEYRTLDAKGDDITPEDRADAVTFLVSLVGTSSDLVVDGTEPWSGKSVC